MVVGGSGDGACGGGLGGGGGVRSKRKERGKKVVGSLESWVRTEQVPMYCTVPCPLAEDSGRRERYTKIHRGTLGTRGAIGGAQ